MQVTTAALLTMLGMMATAVAALFNPKTDSCAPPDGTFENTSAVTYQCDFKSSENGWVYYDCGVYGKVGYNHQKNWVYLNSAIKSFDGDFTIHGSCRKASGRTAHVDIRMPTPANVGTVETYHGLNNGGCDISPRNARGPVKERRTLKFWAYDLTQEQLGECSVHPIKPIE